MDYIVQDFNGAETYFTESGLLRWQELDKVVTGLHLQLQGSDQAGKVGSPIFDPKATNAALTSAAAAAGWSKVDVPSNLEPFGKDWDSGKGAVLAEWQFSNYPFLWNNIIRSEAVFQSQTVLPPLTHPAEALVIVTKSGSLPASNSTLYFEQAQAQIDTVTTLGVFGIPIRLIGLMVPSRATNVSADWNSYSGRYDRHPLSTQRRKFNITWGRNGQYGNAAIKFS